jgi:hypothetical protein
MRPRPHNPGRAPRSATCPARNLEESRGVLAPQPSGQAARGCGFVSHPEHIFRPSFFFFFFFPSGQAARPGHPGSRVEPLCRCRPARRQRRTAPAPAAAAARPRGGTAAGPAPRASAARGAARGPTACRPIPAYAHGSGGARAERAVRDMVRGARRQHFCTARVRARRAVWVAGPWLCHSVLWGDRPTVSGSTTGGQPGSASATDTLSLPPAASAAVCRPGGTGVSSARAGTAREAAGSLDLLQADTSS